ATAAPLLPVRDLPWKLHSPVLGRSNPVSRLNSVVLPAPLGPISAVMTPSWTSRWSTSTAVMPPNLRVTWSATRSGLGLADPGTCLTERSTSAAAVVVSSTDIERQLLLVPEDALWSEDDQQHQGHTDEHAADLLDVGGRDDVTDAGVLGQRPH